VASPYPQLQGCSSSSLGWREASRSRRRTSATRCWPAAGVVSCRVSGSLAWMALVPPPMLPPAVKWGVAVRPPHGQRSRRAQVRRTRSFPCATGYAVPTPPGGCTRRCTPWRWRPRSWMAFSSPPQEDGGEDLSARDEASVVVGKPPVQRWPLSSVLRWSPPLTGAARCRGGRCRW
jgi:hypothetical protein